MYVYFRVHVLPKSASSGVFPSFSSLFGVTNALMTFTSKVACWCVCVCVFLLISTLINKQGSSIKIQEKEI